MLNRKLVLLFLLMCVIGFSVSPVCAMGDDYYYNGHVGSCFEFNEPGYNTHNGDRDHSNAFIESGLFVWYKSDLSTGIVWHFYADKPGFKVIKKDHWDWSSADYYYFDIEV